MKTNTTNQFLLEQKIRYQKECPDGLIRSRKNGQCVKGGWNCEVDSNHPNGWKCVPNLLGTPQYPSEAACIDAPNGCKKWDCLNSFCNDYDDSNAPFDTEQDCLNTYPTGCGDNYDCLPETGNICALVSHQTPYSTLGSCQAAFPNGCSTDYYDCNNSTGNVCGIVTYQTPHSTLGSCQAAFPNGCTPVDYYDCSNSTGNVCGVVNYQTSYQTLSSCQSAFPNGCQETCCDMWACVKKGKFNNCCRPVSLCTLQGHPSPWSSGPGGFPWHLVESSGVPHEEFNKILNENLLMEAPWMCNMSWSSYFGIWLGYTKQECIDGPSWSGVGPASGQPGCGPCAIQDDGDIGMEKMDIDTATNTFNKWKEEGKVEKLSEDFYKNTITLVEEIYRTQNLLKG